MVSNWQIGDRVQNRWEIRKILGGPGKSGMGVIYVVYDCEWHEVLAAKTFQDELFARNPGLASRFSQEALIWVNLEKHQNIVRAYSVENINGKPYLFLEYVAGGDLSGWIGTPRLMEDIPQVLRFAVQICDGMTHALSTGIKAHRDIKPQNCLITKDGMLKVTDFGLAKALDDGRLEREAESDSRADRLSIGMTRTGAGAGTATYMAPEQFDDAKHVDVRADIYSFGVMLYEMIQGRLPFEGSTWHELKQVHKTQAPPPLRTPHPSLATVVEHCLAKNPNDRFGSFDELRVELTRIYEGLTGESVPKPIVGDALDGFELTNKGANLSSLGRHEEAIAYYDLAIERNARNEKAWYNKGNALARMGRYKEAYACHIQAIILKPDDARAWTNLGITLRALGEFENALACHKRAIHFNPRDEAAWGNKGNALASLQRFEEALVCYDQALKLDPRYETAWYNKGNALGALRRNEEAAAAFDQAVALDPGDQSACCNRGNALVALGRYEAALICFDRAISLNPQYALAWFNKGTTLLKVRRYQEALECLQEADRLGYSAAAPIIETVQQAWTRREASSLK